MPNDFSQRPSPGDTASTFETVLTRVSSPAILQLLKMQIPVRPPLTAMPVRVVRPLFVNFIRVAYRVKIPYKGWIL